MANAHEGIDSLIMINKLNEIMKNQEVGISEYKPYGYDFNTPRDRFGALGDERLKQGDSTRFKILPRNESNPIEDLLGLIGGMGNPFASIFNPERKGETLGETYNEYTTGEVNPNVLRKHQTSIDSILGNYVNELMNEKEQRLPKMQYQK